MIASLVRGLRAPLAGLAALCLLAADAVAHVPPAEVVTSEMARANRRAGRAHALVVSVALRDASDRTLARGELRSDPSGLARLELENDGRIERHLLRGGEHLAARGGNLQSVPSPFLPPFFLLQGASAGRLLTGLTSIGGSAQQAVLGRLGDEVCYVLGGRDLEAPANESASLYGSPGRKASLWIARDTFRLARIDRLDGTRYVLGPERAFADVKLPQWVRIERAGTPTVRLEVLEVRRARFDRASTFGMDWLLGR